MTDRRMVLRQAEEAVSRSREADHGAPEDSFRRIAGLWAAYLGHALTGHDVAMLMVLLKVARAQDNPTHVDSLVDIAGYAACAAEVADG